MSFTFDPSTKRGKVRLLVADTNVDDPSRQIFEDEEIDAFLDLEGSEVYPAASAACRSISASAAKSAIAWKALDRSIDKKQVPEHFRELAKEYRERAVHGEPAEEISSMAYDIDDFGTDWGEYEGDIW